MSGPVAAYLDGGTRLHLQHGPIDLIIGCDAETPEAREPAFQAAARCFDGLLERLVTELPALRTPLQPRAAQPSGPVARRMVQAARPFCERHVLTPMIAVAGAVADTVLHAMLSATPLRRAYVNNGGDIALHLGPDASFSVAMTAHGGAGLGTITLTSAGGIGGIATSGAQGRSHSLGIADSVTVLARDAASADVAATLIANTVDLPDNPAIRRCPANTLSPDSDLGDRPVVTAVPALSQQECDAALAAGMAQAQHMLGPDGIIGAALFLQGQSRVVGAMADTIRNDNKELHHA